MKYALAGLGLAMGALLQPAFADEGADQLKGVLEKRLESGNIEVKASEIDGLYEVNSPTHGSFYAAADGNYLFSGTLFELTEDGKIVNLTEQRASLARAEKISGLGDEMIVYPAKEEKYVVTVFTDVSCGYCRKLHSEMSEYNDLGITVRYLAFPRYGTESDTFTQMESIWCAEDPAEAMNMAKGGQDVAQVSCTNSVAEQFRLGQEFGVRGTPAIVMPDGELMPGYLPPAELLKALEG